MIDSENDGNASSQTSGISRLVCHRFGLEAGVERGAIDGQTGLVLYNNVLQLS